MSGFRPNDGPSLQELIDKYNNELLRYQRQAASAANTQITPRPPLTNVGGGNAVNGYMGGSAADEAFEQGMREREIGLEERRQGFLDTARGLSELDAGEQAVERGLAEREYWLHRDEENDRRRNAMGTSGRSWHSSTSIDHAVPVMAEPVLSPDESERWLNDLREGLRELREGLEELRKGREELRQGLEELKNGWDEFLSSTSSNESDRGMGNSSLTAERTVAASAVPGGNWRGPAAAQTRYTGMGQPNGSVGMDGFTDGSVNKTQPRPDNATPLPFGAGVEPPDSGNLSDECCGYLQVAVFTARQAVPIEGARVIVTRGSAGEEQIYASSETNRNGKTPAIKLPVSEQSGSQVYAPPYVIYHVQVTADNYYPQMELNAQVFRGITATLPVEMIPLPDGYNISSGVS